MVDLRRRGLSAQEAAARLAADGPNALPRMDRRTALRIAGEVLREPMLALLLGGGFVYLLLGSVGEALILLAFATFSVMVTVIQEARTERVLEALRDLSAPRALVIRDGAQMRIAGREVVAGDLVILEQGDRVPADGLVLEARELEADESHLTGESLPVGKIAIPSGKVPPGRRPGGEAQPFIYSGSMIVRGSGLAEVTATGQRSEIGKIGGALAALEPEQPRLRRETARIVRLCAVGGGAIALLVVLLHGLTRGSWLDALLAGIATGMAMLPEEFPVVLTVFLAMGAWRIGRAGVLTRRAAAIETLGATTVLCADKTGTLTENHMAVVRLWRPGHGTTPLEPGNPLSEQFASLIETGVLASSVEAVDPMETAIHAAGRSHGSDCHAQRELSRSHGISPELLAMSNLWQVGGDPGGFLVAAKGAPEAVARLCRLDPAETAELLQAAEAMAADGIRVLGAATAAVSDGTRALSQSDYPFALAGLIGLADPLRATVPDTVARCRAAGIKVVMITGDYAPTARAIAHAAGLADGEVLTGAELDALDDQALAARLADTTVFARILPEQKLRIVEAFKAAGEIVAMTGDGVNDAPSLKAAHIGIAMGKRGTDVAREAAGIVLLDDDFASIVRAVGLGRQIYDNIRKATAFIFAVHVPIAGLALLPLLAGQPLLLGPIHIALLEMIIDPVCALVFEAEAPERDTMTRPPRDPAQRLFSLPMIGWSVFQGGLTLGVLATTYLIALWYGMAEADLRGLVYFALIAAIFVLILVNRSFSPSLRHALGRSNRALAVVAVAVGAIAALVLLAAPLRALLSFGTLHAIDVGIVAGLAVLLLIALELLKPCAQKGLP